MRSLRAAYRRVPPLTPIHTRDAAVAQLERWLPRACSGEHIGGMGMSEPSCGTDVLAMRTTAQPLVEVGEAATPTCLECRGLGLAGLERAPRCWPQDHPSPPITQARAQPDGSFKLNGTKMWITNGAVNDTDTGDVFLVCARRLRRRPRDAGKLPRWGGRLAPPTLRDRGTGLHALRSLVAGHALFLSPTRRPSTPSPPV